MYVRCIKSLELNGRTLFLKGKSYVAAKENLFKENFGDGKYTGVGYVCTNEQGQRHIITTERGLLYTTSFFYKYFSRSAVPTEVNLTV